jgi:DNA-binding transcriptional ArsR family regulator
MTRVIKDHDPRLTPSLKLTLVTLASYHSEKDPSRGTPSRLDRVMADTGLSRRRVQEHLNRLEELGKVLVERPSPKRRGRIYVLTSNATDRVSDTRTLALPNATDRVATSQVEENKPREIKPLRGGAAAPGEEDVPDGRLVGEEPDFDDKPKPKPKKPRGVPTRGTSQFAWRRFDSICKGRWGLSHNAGSLKAHVKALHVEHGLDYDQVVDFMEYWANREDANIRRKSAGRDPLDPSDAFRQSIQANLVDTFKRERLQANKKTNTALGAPSIREKMGW